MFTTAQYDTSDTDSQPATDGRYTGAGFMPQTVTGVRNVDNEDDRVTYEASIMSTSPQAFSHSLPANVDATGLQSVYGGTIFGGIRYSDREDVWYDTLRPQAGFPLDPSDDIVYANRTNDLTGGSLGDVSPISVIDGNRITEQSFDYPSRPSVHPVEAQHERPWDVLLGAWPWTGEKNALQSPSAATPITFDTPLYDAMPSGTGTANVDHSGQNVYPQPLTFRMPPDPWATDNGGQYVDGG